MTLLDEGTKQLGVRFLLVGLLPSSLFVAIVGAVAYPWIRAPLEEALRSHGMSLTTVASTALLGSAFALAVLLDLLQLRLTQLLEGYWPEHAPFSWLREALIARQKRGRSRAEERTTPQQAFEFLNYYPDEDRLMPTRFGNVLRNAEDLAGRRYGLDSVVVWPRLYFVLPKDARELLEDGRNQMDLGVRLVWLFLAGAAVSLLGIARSPWWLAASLAQIALAGLSYQAAIAAAMQYGTLVQAAFDVFRFDLYKKMGLKTPRDTAEERDNNARLSEWLRTDPQISVSYETSAPPKPGS